MSNWSKITDSRHLLWVWLLMLGACQSNKKPDLAQLYQQHATDHSNTPLVLIHGTMGSKLRFKETQQQVWPGKINQLIFSNYKKLANRIDASGLDVVEPDIESYAIFDSYSGLSIYDEIIDTLVEFGGYQQSDFNHFDRTKRNLYIFHYDWRQDNVKSAAKLDEFIEQVLQNHPNHDQVDVVAHSMGGLILRYYQRYGSHDVLENIEKYMSGEWTPDLEHYSKTHRIRHAIFLGTPQLGSVKSIKRLQEGFDFNLRNIPVEVQITMPTVYQLLPHPQHQWSLDPNGDPVDLDLFDPSLWKNNQWSIYNPQVQKKIIKRAQNETSGQAEVSKLQQFFNHQLTRARLFWLALSPGFEDDHEGFIIMGGDCKDTLSHLIVSQDEQFMQLGDKVSLSDHFGSRAQYQNILFEPGDGQVSKSSLLGQVHDIATHENHKTIKIKYPVFVCEEHFKLTQNLTFQDNLLHILLHE